MKFFERIRVERFLQCSSMSIVSDKSTELKNMFFNAPGLTTETKRV